MIKIILDIFKNECNYNNINNIGSKKLRNIKTGVNLIDAIYYRFSYTSKNTTKESITSDLNYTNNTALSRQAFDRKENNIPINMYRNILNKIIHFYNNYTNSDNNINIIDDNDNDNDNNDIDNNINIIDDNDNDIDKNNENNFVDNDIDNNENNIDDNNNNNDIFGNMNIISIDGTYNNDNKEMLNMGFFNVTKNVPIELKSCGYHNKNNEVKCAIKFIKKHIDLFKNNILVADRLYFTYEFLYFLNENDLKFIIRAKGDAQNLEPNTPLKKRYQRLQ